MTDTPDNRSAHHDAIEDHPTSEMEILRQTLQAQAEEIQQLKGELIAQEHRFFPTWWNFFCSVFKKDQRRYAWDASKAVLQRFVPGATAAILIGGGLAGTLTVILMHQGNQLTARQNEYLQQQILIQAESDRRDQLVNIMEKLYEPTEASRDAVRTFEALPTKEQRGKEAPKLEPQYNSQTRTQSVLAYLNIQHRPLKEVEPATLSTIPQVSRTLWDALTDFTTGTQDQETEEVWPCSHLTYEILSSVDLHEALLSEVYLLSVCLQEADLWRADLRRADLRGADLKRANLRGANLRGTNLQEADLREADLRGTNLQGANLWGADLQGADIREANLKRANLEGALGLTCKQLEMAVNWQSAQSDLTCIAN